MTVNPFLQLVLNAVDFWAAMVPRPVPSEEAFNQCKIISHRGEHDNRSIRENTFSAFDRAREAGAWGLETDIRWTRDLVPVVHHDPDSSRVFGKRLVIGETDFGTLRNEIPEIPSLAEFIAEFGGNTHLMVELKAENFPQIQKQRKILHEHFAALQPCVDYHILALDPALFDHFDIHPKEARLPVALLNIKALSRIALEQGLAGISGHFLLLSHHMQAEHKRAGQKIGPGFPGSKNALFRELNRGADWIFTNDAVKLLTIVQSVKKTAPVRRGFNS